MKYIFNPIGRVIIVLFAFAMFPIIIFFEGLKGLWHWKKSYITDVMYAFRHNFWTEDSFRFASIGELYECYETPLDYILKRVTIRECNIKDKNY